MRILVIDDDAQVGLSLQRLLRREDVSVETDPRIALSRVAAGYAAGAPFDVVLCDLQMPGMTGVEVIRALRTADRPPLLILMSGDHRISESTSEADGVLAKPFTRDELRDMLRRSPRERTVTVTARLRPLHAEIARSAQD